MSEDSAPCTVNAEGQNERNYNGAHAKSQVSQPCTGLRPKFTLDISLLLLSNPIGISPLSPEMTCLNPFFFLLSWRQTQVLQQCFSNPDLRCLALGDSTAAILAELLQRSTRSATRRARSL
eukprot:2264953-Rhodomonas_salina.1